MKSCATSIMFVNAMVSFCYKAEGWSNNICQGCFLSKPYSLEHGNFWVIFDRDCRYPADWVHLRTSSNSRRRSRRTLTRTHVSMTSNYATRHEHLGYHHTFCGASSRLLVRGSSGATTCLVALAPKSQLGAARVLPRVPWRQLPPPGTGQLQSCHVSYDSSSCILAQGSSGAATCPMVLYGLWAIEVNKYPPVALPS
jgi:hypothetical protein